MGGAANGRRDQRPEALAAESKEVSRFVVSLYTARVQENLRAPPPREGGGGY
jgi:hypothetical protein